MKYSIDSALCSGHGQCEMVAGEVFTIDEDGYNRDNGRTVEVPAGLEDAARRGADSCPDQAIRVSVRVFLASFEYDAVGKSIDPV